MVIIPAGEPLAPPKFAARLAFVLHEEGGYVDDPQDAGGITDFGITLANWRVFTGNPDATADELRRLTPAQKTAFYGAQYWNPMAGEGLPPGIDLMGFDHAVNAGVCRSAMLLQQALDVTQDGHVGRQTLAFAQRASPAAVVDRLARLQEAFYRTRPRFDRFGAGWLNRLDRRTKASHDLLFNPGALS